MNSTQHQVSLSVSRMSTEGVGGDTLWRLTYFFVVGVLRNNADVRTGSRNPAVFVPRTTRRNGKTGATHYHRDFNRSFFEGSPPQPKLNSTRCNKYSI